MPVYGMNGLADLACMCNRKTATTGLGALFGDDDYNYGIDVDKKIAEQYGGSSSGPSASTLDKIGNFFGSIAKGFTGGGGAQPQRTQAFPTPSAFSTENIVKYATIGVAVILGAVVLKRVVSSRST